MDEPRHGSEGDQAGEHEEGRAVRLGREHVHPAKAESDIAARGPPDQAEHEQREEKRPGVDEHVRRVGEECERVGQDAGDDLADHEGDDQRQAGAEPTRIGALLDDMHVQA